MKIILFSLFLLFSPLAFAQCNGTSDTVVTGYGYLTNAQGHIFSYAQYPAGSICIPTGVTYTEVANQEALNSVLIYQAPVDPVANFNTDIFVQQLAQTSLISDPALFPFYAVLKDMTFYKNFQALANMIAGLLQAGQLNQSEVDVIDNTLENQEINLDSYNSAVNVAY